MARRRLIAPEYPRNPWLLTIWARIERLAARLSGREVIAALERASLGVYRAGLDRDFHLSMRGRKLEDAAHCFDITWTSVLAVELSRAALPRGGRAAARERTEEPNRG